MDFDALEAAETEDAADHLEDFLRSTGVTLKELEKKEKLQLSSLHALPQDLHRFAPRLRVLKASGCNLKSLPQGLEHLEELDLSGNWLQHLELRMESLLQLALAKNQLSELTLCCPKLRRLDVRENRLESLDLSDLHYLLELDATQNRLSEVCLASAETVWLSGNRMSAPPELAREQELRGLQLAYNELQELPGGQWRQLEHLDVSHNYLLRLPKLELEALRSLNLASNRITHVKLQGFPKLRHLDLAENMLDEMPEGLGDLTTLERVDFRDNPWLTRLSGNPLDPGWFTLCLLHHMGCDCGLSVPAVHQVLDLGRRKLRSLPCSIASLRHVTCLDLEENGLRELPQELGRLPLKSLILSKNQLTALPKSLGLMSTLRRLGVSQNRLETLPPLQLGQLELLEMGRNLLRRLPEMTTPQLKELEIDQNRLVALPDLSGFSQLRRFKLDGNELTSLPRSFASLKRLTELRMTGNALATMLLEREDLPEQRLLWEMNQWGQLATIELQAQQPGPVPEALVLWRWATAWPAAPAAGAVVNVAPESVVETLQRRLDAVRDDIPGAQRLLKQLFREWHPDKRLDEKELATRVFQWLQEVKKQYT